MQKIKLFLLAVFAGLLFLSCDPCFNLKCASSNFNGQFRIVRATDGADLVFGPTKVYDTSAIKFFTFKGTDTTFFAHEYIKFGGAGYDSIIYVHFYSKPEIAVAYMRLSNNDVDTLQISYETSRSRCCGTMTEITKFRYNNLMDIPGKEGTQALKK